MNPEQPQPAPKPSRLAPWRRGWLMSGTLSGTAWQLARLLLQTLSLVLLARTLGVRGYGVLTGSVALYTILAQLVGLGTGMAILRNRSRNTGDDYHRWKATLVIYWGSGIAILLVTLPAAVWISGAAADGWTLLAIGWAELVAAPSLQPSAFCVLARNRAATFGALLAIPAATRLAATLCLLLVAKPTLADYARVYIAVSTAAAILVTVRFRNLLAGESGAAGPPINVLLREGSPYLAGTFAPTAAAEVDKTLLMNLLGAQPAGQYGAAFRMAQAVTAPVNAMVVALAPRLFQFTDYRQFWSAFRRCLGWALAYAVTAAGVCWLAAPLLSLLLGADFRSSQPILRFLSLYVIANSARQLVSGALTGADRQWSRNAIEACGVAGVIIADLVAIPAFGWRGAASVATAGDALVSMAGLAVLRSGRRRPARTDRWQLPADD